MARPRSPIVRQMVDDRRRREQCVDQGGSWSGADEEESRRRRGNSSDDVAECGDHRSSPAIPVGPWLQSSHVRAIACCRRGRRRGLDVSVTRTDLHLADADLPLVPGGCPVIRSSAASCTSSRAGTVHRRRPIGIPWLPVPASLSVGLEQDGRTCAAPQYTGWTPTAASRVPPRVPRPTRTASRRSLLTRAVRAAPVLQDHRFIVRYTGPRCPSGRRLRIYASASAHLTAGLAITVAQRSTSWHVVARHDGSASSVGCLRNSTYEAASGVSGRGHPLRACQ